MSLRALVGIFALLPAAFNVSPAGVRGIAVPLCAGDGLPRTVTVPGAGGAPADEVPGKDQPGCCAKACHTGSRKKPLPGQIDAGQ